TGRGVGVGQSNPTFGTSMAEGDGMPIRPRSWVSLTYRSCSRGDRAMGPTVAVVATVALLFLAVAGTLAAVAAAPGAAAGAAARAWCSFGTGGSGTFARTLCWFDLSGYNATAAGSAAGQSMTVGLPGGYTISFTLKVSGGAAAPFAFPTFSGA